MFRKQHQIDIGEEKTALKEAKGRGLPVFSLLDTDSDPGKVDFPIVANDDSVKSVALIIEEIGKALKVK
jgi:small subunit ribosomal protein S2